jgi:hypothetical protein
MVNRVEVQAPHFAAFFKVSAAQLGVLPAVGAATVDQTSITMAHATRMSLPLSYDVTIVPPAPAPEPTPESTPPTPPPTPAPPTPPPTPPAPSARPEANEFAGYLVLGVGTLVVAGGFVFGVRKIHQGHPGKYLGIGTFLVLKIILTTYDFISDCLFCYLRSYDADPTYFYASLASLVTSCIAGFIVSFVFLGFQCQPARFVDPQKGTWLSQLDKDLYDPDEYKPFWVAVFLMSCTQLEFLKLLPWKKRPTGYGKFPDRPLLFFTFTTLALEDVPQFIMQVLFSRANGGDATTTLSLAGTALSIVVFGLAKAISVASRPAAGGGYSGATTNRDGGHAADDSPIAKGQLDQALAQAQVQAAS